MFPIQSSEGKIIFSYIKRQVNSENWRKSVRFTHWIKWQEMLRPLWCCGAHLLSQHMGRGAGASRIKGQTELHKALAPTWQLTTICNSSPKGPYALFWPTCTRYTDMLAGKIFIHIRLKMKEKHKFRKPVFLKQWCLQMVGSVSECWLFMATWTVLTFIGTEFFTRMAS